MYLSPELCTESLLCNCEACRDHRDALDQMYQLELDERKFYELYPAYGE